MLLYHGTYDSEYAEINTQKVIKSTIAPSEATSIINDQINKYTGKNIRRNCVYLTNDNDTTQSYDWAFTVDSNDLNLPLLFVADNTLANEIYNAYMAGKEEHFIKFYVMKYIRSFISFEKYKEIEESYRFIPEFLYFGDILCANFD